MLLLFAPSFPIFLFLPSLADPSSTRLSSLFSPPSFSVFKLIQIQSLITRDMSTRTPSKPFSAWKRRKVLAPLSPSSPPLDSALSRAPRASFDEPFLTNRLRRDVDLYPFQASYFPSLRLHSLTCRGPLRSSSSLTLSSSRAVCRPPAVTLTCTRYQRVALVMLCNSSCVINDFQL